MEGVPLTYVSINFDKENVGVPKPVLSKTLKLGLGKIFIVLIRRNVVIMFFVML